MTDPRGLVPPDPEAEFDLPIADPGATPDDVKSGDDESAYQPAQDDPSEDHEPTEDPQ